MSDVIAFLALLGTAIIGFLQWKQHERINAIEEARRREEVESRQRAVVTAEFVPLTTADGRSKCHLVVRNDGPAEARGVDFVLGPEAKDGPLLRDAPFPLEVLRPGGSFKMRAVLFGETAPHVTARLSWTDGVGEHADDLLLSVPGP